MLSSPFLIIYTSFFWLLLIKSWERFNIIKGVYCVCVCFQDVQEADRPEEGFYIRSGITVVVEKATIKDGTVI